MKPKRLILLTGILLISGCASNQPKSVEFGGQPEKEVSVSPSQAALPIPQPPKRPTPIKQVPAPISESPNNIIPFNWKNIVRSLLPDNIKDRDGWADDIYQSFYSQQLNLTKENICAAVAVIDQESSFNSDPEVKGLAQIVRKELENRREKYHVPQWMLEKALEVKSPNGQTYARRIKTLKTEKDINQLFDDMTAQLPLGKLLLSDYNPVRTGGPMQVSVSFAETFSKANKYPFAIRKSLRDEVFSRKGGVYFGIAHLLNYPANYDNMKYRFADFNSGHYTSRNAAFQSIVSKISKKKISLDGDLLTYDGNDPKAGKFEDVLISISPTLKMNGAEIRSDLLLEKTKDFEQTLLYKRIYQLASQRGIKSEYALIPRIRLHSPKITSKLTTEWFVDKVNQHYNACLSRQI